MICMCMYVCLFEKQIGISKLIAQCQTLDTFEIYSEYCHLILQFDFNNDETAIVVNIVTQKLLQSFFERTAFARG